LILSILLIFSIPISLWKSQPTIWLSGPDKEANVRHGGQVIGLLGHRQFEEAPTLKVRAQLHAVGLVPGQGDAFLELGQLGATLLHIGHRLVQSMARLFPLGLQVGNCLVHLKVVVDFYKILLFIKLLCCFMQILHFSMISTAIDFLNGKACVYLMCFNFNVEIPQKYLYVFQSIKHNSTCVFFVCV
jgi:hypothetical protein